MKELHEEEEKLMIEFSYISVETVNYIGVKVLWDIIKEAIYNRNNVSNEYWKLTTKNQLKTWIGLHETARFISSRYEIPVIHHKYTLGLPFHILQSVRLK